MNSFMKEFEEQFRLERLEKKLGSARLIQENHCVSCGFCCKKRTCIPSPDELVDIAEYLKTTPEKLISTKFVIDRLTFKSPYFVKPAASNITDLVGKFVPSDRTFNEGTCVFLKKNNRCEIYYVRPKSAKVMECWNDNKDNEVILNFAD